MLSALVRGTSLMVKTQALKQVRPRLESWLCLYGSVPVRRPAPLALSSNCSQVEMLIYTSVFQSYMK